MTVVSMLAHYSQAVTVTFGVLDQVKMRSGVHPTGSVALVEAAKTRFVANELHMCQELAAQMELRFSQAPNGDIKKSVDGKPYFDFYMEHKGRGQKVGSVSLFGTTMYTTAFSWGSVVHPGAKKRQYEQYAIDKASRWSMILTGFEFNPEEQVAVADPVATMCGHGLYALYLKVVRFCVDHAATVFTKQDVLNAVNAVLVTRDQWVKYGASRGVTRTLWQLNDPTPLSGVPGEFDAPALVSGADPAWSLATNKVVFQSSVRLDKYLIADYLKSAAGLMTSAGLDPGNFPTISLSMPIMFENKEGKGDNPSIYKFDWAGAPDVDGRPTRCDVLADMIEAARSTGGLHDAAQPEVLSSGKSITAHNLPVGDGAAVRVEGLPKVTIAADGHVSFSVNALTVTLIARSDPVIHGRPYRLLGHAGLRAEVDTGADDADCIGLGFPISTAVPAPAPAPATSTDETEMRNMIAAVMKTVGSGGGGAGTGTALRSPGPGADLDIDLMPVSEPEPEPEPDPDPEPEPEPEPESSRQNKRRRVVT